MPRAGGIARVVAYPDLDSTLWKSVTPAASVGRVLGFDDEAGSIAYEDARGFPGRIDLRLGTVPAPRGKKETPRLAGLASADGWAIFGIGKDGSVARLTPSGSWTFKPPAPARAVFPQPDGALLVLADRGAQTAVWQLHPPEPRVLDSAVVPRSHGAVRTQVGDRVYFTVDSGLIGLRGRDLAPVRPVRLKEPVRTLVPTPSGDRLYIVTDSSSELTVFDRYAEERGQSIELGGVPRDLRMDPLGRYLLARAEGDSAWVIAIGTDRVVATVATAWRDDLPAVAPDGAIVTVVGDAVRFVDAERMRATRTVPAGAKDFWYFFSWSGFRPRAAELDQPVTFDTVPRDSTAADSTARDTLAVIRDAPGLDTGFVPRQPPVTPQATLPSTSPTPAATPASPPPGAPPARDTAAAPRLRGWLVSFAALREEPQARAMAAQIQVDGRTAQVMPTQVSGVAIFRVVLGPFPTRGDAERAGRASGRSYWVFEATP